MNSDTPVDYALFQLSPRRSRCELFVSAGGKTEKLASGFLKPFVTHLKVAEEQVAQAGQMIKLEVDRKKNSAIWFNKGTLERFVRFVSTPDVLELVNTFDAEMTQLEGARQIYSQGAADPLSGSTGENERSTASNADITKTELLKAIEVRLLALKQELSMACGRASAAGFTLDNISELLLFSDHFGAYRLNEACTNFISLCQRRPELIIHRHHRSPPSQQQQWKEDRDLCSSSSSDMSIDNDLDDTNTTSASLKPSTACQRTTQKAAPKQQFVESEKGGSGERNGDLLPGLTQPPPQASGTRRLSVQDRINLFENKQKEQLGGGAGSKIGGKVELRRISSDISSSVEKSVLRRWSGASDMSIDLNSNNSFSGRKELESTATTPSSSFNTQTHTESRNVENDTAASQPRSGSGSGSDDWPSLLSSSSFSSSTYLPQDQTQRGSFSKDRDHTQGTYLKDQVASATDSTQLKSMSARELFDSMGSSRVESVERRGLGNFQNLYKVSLNVEEHTELNDGLYAAGSHLTGVSLEKGLSGGKSAPEDDEASKIPHDGCLTNKLSSMEAELAVPAVRTVSSSAIAQFRASSGSRNVDTVSNKKAPSKSESQPKTFQGTVEDTQVKSSQLLSDLRGENFTCKSEETSKRTDPWQVQSGGFLPKVRREEHSGGTSLNQQDVKLHRQTSDLDLARKSQCKRVERKPQSSVLPVSIGRKPKVSEESLELNSAPSIGSVHTTKPSKGKHELNNELQMKADELEKLFAAHKLRLPGDQTASTHRIKPSDSQAYSVSKDKTRPVDFLPECRPVKDSNDAGMKSDANMLMKMLDNQDYSYGSTHKLGDISSQTDVRGRFYGKYMEKRDGKLREEWGSKRAQKEAKMKAMQDNLERTRAELKTRFSGSGKRSDSAVFSHLRAEKLRNYNARAIMKNKEQSVDFQQKEDAQDAFEQRGYGDDRFLSETPPSDCSSKSSYSKRLLPNKSAASSFPRNTAVLSAASQQTNSGPGRHRIQPENPLAQSVPNFSDMQRENTKTPPGVSRMATHAQARNSTRSKSISEEMVFDKEDRPHSSQSTRKSSAYPIELKGNSTINSREQSNQKQIKKGMESRSFLRKGNGIRPGSGVGLAKLRASMVSGNLISEENSEELAAQMEIPQSIVTQDDECEVLSARELSRTGNEKPRLSADSLHSCDQELQNGEILESFSQVDDDSTAELAATSSRIHNSTATMHDSPGESPLSWNSRIHHSFSYAQEASDIDASVESPLGSPSWNSHPLKQMMESDASRIRKKWGSAQKPIIVSNTSHRPRKDVTRGFKRLLKFGKKNKGADNLINDWISASTNSEGDDDAEDGHDPANRVSDDVQKSRTGFTQFHSAYDGFNEGDIFQYQAQAFHSSTPGAPPNIRMREDQLSGSSMKAPRSFFSLSTFRGKGGDSKSR